MTEILQNDQELILRARYCDIAERYPEMSEVMRQAMQNCLKNGWDITMEHRNLFSLAFKNLVSLRRSSWRMLYSERQKLEERRTNDIIVVDELLSVVQQELLDLCDDVIRIIDETALLNKDDPARVEHNVFFLKMKGDYFRYKAEVLLGEEGKAASSSAMENYVAAKEQARSLDPTNPIRLGLLLNFSVFNYEILNNSDLACEIARTAFNDAIAELDSLSEDYYKDSTLIMQLLRDNLTLWSSKSEMANRNAEGNN